MEKEGIQPCPHPISTQLGVEKPESVKSNLIQRGENKVATKKKRGKPEKDE